MKQPTVYVAVGGEYSDYRLYAAFATREAAQAFIDHPDSQADAIETMTVFDSMPTRYRVHVIERLTYDRENARRCSHLLWEMEGMGYEGEKRKSWNYSKWQYGERAWGTDKAAVEKAWKEAHAGEEARDAGV
jgi:hypothetical protein